MNRVALQVIIPIYHPDEKFIELLNMLKKQSIPDIPVLIIDSGSDKEWCKAAQGLNCQLKDIDSKDFNHGGTRQMGIDMCLGKEIIVFLTQDAILADEYSIENLVRAFDDIGVGCAYGRQLPHNDANVFASFARLHNYPAESYVRSYADRSRYGLKTAFLSNSFAAYRRNAIEKVGGFPSDVILSEDMYVAARMLMSGWKVAYAAEARVYHSHNYTVWQEFKRYFDIGVFHARESWIRKNLGNAEGSGKKFIVAEFNFLALRNPLLICEMVFRDGMKFLGYRLGIKEKMFSNVLKRNISMNSKYYEVFR